MTILNMLTGIKDFDDWKKTSPVSPIHVTTEIIEKI